MKKIILCLCIGALVLTGCTSKPSKAEIEKSFTAILVKEFGSTATDKQKSQLKQYVDCIVDETYDDVSAKTWNKIIDAKSANDLSATSGTKNEKKKLDAAAQKCQDKLK